MHLGRQHVGPGHQDTPRVEHGRDGVIVQPRGCQGGVAHRPAGHIGPQQFDPVEVDDNPVVEDGRQVEPEIKSLL